MERVKTLTEKLVNQIKEGAPAAQLLLTVQMLQSELQHEVHQGQQGEEEIFVALNLAPVLESRQAPINQDPVPVQEVTQVPETKKEEEKIVEILQVDEAEMEAELEEIKRKAEEINKLSTQNKPGLLFDPIDDFPTMIHQQAHTPPAKEVKDILPTERGASLNDKLKQGTIELSETLSESPIKDLKKAININDRFVFIKELFRGDENMYERSIKTINGFSIYAEAEYWIRRELKLKLGWNDKNELVKHFEKLVKRRFAQ
ncbi:MAG TPA: hypothetical protein PLN30_02470 [Ferruginibacter sp.]|nr:hypothetical protein [Ferruginibacter sp.]